MLGTTVSHYRLVEKLGEGGMGEVFVAEDETLHRRVALKAIHAERRLDERARARFLREARILSQLDHPHICRIHDYVESDDGDFLVLELVEGKDLRHATADGVDRGTALDVLGKVNDALLAAHAAGVVHRDLKPGNVMLTADGGVKVLDFGLARTADAPVIGVAPDAGAPSNGDPALDLTEEGASIGTLRYMAPEQARGEPATSASDMYALGLLFVEMVTGKPAFPLYRSFDDLLRHVQAGAQVPEAMRSTELGRLAAKLLHPAPAMRPTAVDVAERLQWVRERPRRIARRSVLAAVAIVAVLAGVKYTTDLDAERERAVSERRKAEDLVDFMIGDLRETLDSVGRLDALGDTADKVLAYLESREDEERGDGDAYRRARALMHVGQVRLDQGRLQDALPLFEEAHEICERLRRVDRANVEWGLLLNESHFWIANVLFSREDLDGAEARFVEYRDLAEELVAQDPEDVRFQRELAYAHTNMTALHMSRGDLEAAIGTARESIEIKRAVCALEPSNDDRKRDLANGLSWLSGALEEADRVRESVAHRCEELEIRRHLAAAAPRDTEARRLLSISLQLLAHSLGLLGREEEARDLLQEDIEISQELLDFEPTNADWRRGLAVSQRTCAAVLVRLGKLDQATRLAEASRAHYEELVALDTSNPDFQRGLAAIHEVLAAMHFRRGELEPALEATAEAERLARICEDFGDDSDDLLATKGRALLFRGLARAALGDVEDARSCWELGETMLSARGGADAEREIVFVRIRILMRLGRVEEAEPLARRLLEREFARRDFIEMCGRYGWK